jgi:hypothetical protein
MNSEDTSGENQLSYKGDELLTMVDLKREIRYCERYIRQLLQTGEIKGWKLREGRGKWVVPRSEVNRFLGEIELSGKTDFTQKLQSEADAGTKALETPTGFKEDPLIIEKRRQHFSDLQNIGKDLIACLDNFLVGWFDEDSFPVDNHRTDAYGALDHLLGKLGQLERDPLFECLQEHILDSSLWQSYNTLEGKAILCMSIWEEICTTANVDEIKEICNSYNLTTDWDTLPPKDALENVLSDAGKQFVDTVLIVKRYLTLALSRGIPPGKCAACPIDYRSE